MVQSLTGCSRTPTAILAEDGGRNFKRILTHAEIDLLLAGEQPEGAAKERR